MRAIVQPGAGVASVVQAIRRARTTIDVCIFRLDRKEIEEALTSAVHRGVRVRALIANTNTGGEASLRKLEQRLLAGGIMVTRTDDELVRYHGKYMVADAVLYVFGFNFTKLDIEKSRSFAIATRDLRTVKEAQKLFESDSNRQPYAPARSNLVVSPETAREVLGKFIAGAKKELAIYDVNIQDPAMIKTLKERASKGVQIRVIGNLKDAIDNVTVRRPGALRIHVRAIIRDGTRAFIGSQSLRKVELDKRREIGVLITNPVVTRQLMQVFEADWAPRVVSEAKEHGSDEIAV
jgi:phosphatidylserine/phosphatidylglycerophosphate/cardiolipin synthase-like enzyme